MKRVISNKGTVVITNNKQMKLDISMEMMTFLTYVESLEEEVRNLKTSNENFKTKFAQIDRYKRAVEEILERKRILESDPNFIVKRKIKQLSKKSPAYMEDLSMKDYELIELFEILEKYKIQ